MPEEQLNEVVAPEKNEKKQNNQNNSKPRNIQDGIRIISRKTHRGPKY